MPLTAPRAWSTLAPLLAAAFATACSREPPRPNVLLITVDTLRADRLAALAPGGKARARPVMPHLDALAAEGLLAPRATAPRAKTTPALASLMTGLYPHDHGVRDLMAPLALQHATLAERLRAAGWRTGAIVGNYVLQARFSGLERGFEQWTEELPHAQGVPPDDVPQRLAHSVTDGALAALGLEDGAALEAGPRSAFAREGEPWFLWLHYMDPHGTYEAPREPGDLRGEPLQVVELLPPAPTDPAAAARRFVAEYNVPARARLPDGRIDVAAVRRAYDGEARYADAEIGRLLARLRERGLLANTLVIVTADHGESFGEHDYWFEHGRDAYEAGLHVPFVVRLPDAPASTGVPRGARLEENVSLCDVAPTLLEWLGLPPLAAPTATGMKDGPRGRSLAAAWRGATPSPAPVFAEKVDRVERARTVQQKTARLGDWKLVRRYAALPEPGAVDVGLRLLAEELYDLASDPREERDLAAAPPASAPLERLRAELTRYVAADARFGAQAEELERLRARLDPAVRRVLEGMGY